MRVIDADYLKEKGHYDDHDVFVVDYDDIKNAPTIDPVKHGWWIERRDGELLWDECSTCGYVNEYERFSYCPNCGALNIEVWENTDEVEE